LRTQAGAVAPVGAKDAAPKKWRRHPRTKQGIGLSVSCGINRGKLGGFDWMWRQST